MKRSGVADLPLHGGRVPQWLARRMTMLGTGITEAIVHDYGTSGFLSRLRTIQTISAGRTTGIKQLIFCVFSGGRL
jgi:hypothetical protein